MENFSGNMYRSPLKQTASIFYPYFLNRKLNFLAIILTFDELIHFILIFYYFSILGTIYMKLMV